MEETPEDRKAVEWLDAERRRDRLGVGLSRERLAGSQKETLAVTSVPLHLRYAEALGRSAERLGYRQEPLSGAASPAERSLLRLTGSNGERLAIERTAQGRLVVHTAGGRRRVQTLVQQHVVDRASAHFQAKGRHLQTHRLPSGEMQMVVSLPDEAGRGEQPVVKVQVGQDGLTWVDVNCTKGSRCQTIVEEFAETVGRAVAAMSKKDASYEWTGEPVQPGVEV